MTPPPGKPTTRRPRRVVNARGELNEATWQAKVKLLAGYYGWRTYHTHDSRRSDVGFPDLILIRGPELIAVELKANTPSGTRALAAEVARRPEWLRSRDLSGPQAAWLEAFAFIGAEVATALLAAEASGRDYEARLAVEAHVWRPRDWELVQARLARGRVRQDAVGPSYEDPAGD